MKIDWPLIGHNQHRHCAGDRECRASETSNYKHVIQIEIMNGMAITSVTIYNLVSIDTLNYIMDQRNFCMERSNFSMERRNLDYGVD